jgi:hypothetical protein
MVLLANRFWDCEEEEEEEEESPLLGGFCGWCRIKKEIDVWILQSFSIVPFYSFLYKLFPCFIILHMIHDNAL